MAPSPTSSAVRPSQVGTVPLPGVVAEGGCSGGAAGGKVDGDRGCSTCSARSTSCLSRSSSRRAAVAALSPLPPLALPPLVPMPLHSIQQQQQAEAPTATVPAIMSMGRLTLRSPLSPPTPDRAPGEGLRLAAAPPLSPSAAAGSAEPDAIYYSWRKMIAIARAGRG